MQSKTQGPTTYDHLRKDRALERSAASKGAALCLPSACARPDKDASVGCEKGTEV